jgi:threonine/homoserine/homoserine lactone efflux protein
VVTLAAVGALTLLTLLPGPDVAVVTRVALSRGRPAALRTSLGIVCGLLTWGLLTVAGLAALLAASATAYTVVRLAGGAYLCLLGIRAIRSAGTAHEEAAPAHRGSPWRTGFVSNVLNPKIAAFYTGVLPQLVPEGAPHAAGLAALVAVHVAVTLAWLALYAALVTRAARALRRPRVRRALDRVTGVVLLGFGVRVAAA